MKIYDISVTISNRIPTWPGDPAVSIEQVKSLTNGDGANVSYLSMGAHTGTHIDAPYHFLADGTTTDAVSLDRLIGPCRVVELDVDEVISASDLQRADFNNCEKILFKTKNSKLWQDKTEDFVKNFIALDLSAADYLVEKNVKLVGIDYLSIEGFYADENRVHKRLLENNILPLEGINLSGIAPGDYELICLPLKISHTDGAPVRAVLRDLTSDS